jgi:hypothetical protein
MESDFDASTGSVFFEVELLLSSDSGRPKHTDPTEQGGWLMIPIREALTSIPMEGAAFGRIRYWGSNCTPIGAPLIEQEVGSHQQPQVDE